MTDKAKSRKVILSMTLEDVLEELKDAMSLANKSGDFCATVSFANRINVIEDIIDGFVTADVDTEGLITERYA